MGDKNLALKRYLSNNQVFADIFNLKFTRDGLTIDPQRLQDIDSVQVMSLPLKEGGRRGRRKTAFYRERIHDAAKAFMDNVNGSRPILMLGIEGQTSPSLVMALRILQYEDHMLTFAMEMQKKEIQDENGVDFLSGMSPEEQLPPVLSIVLHMGSKPWDGPTNLRQMLLKQPRRLYNRMVNLSLNIVTMEDISRRNIDSFSSDIGVVAAYLIHGKNPDKLKKLKQKYKRFRNVSPEAINLINEYTRLRINIP